MTHEQEHPQWPIGKTARVVRRTSVHSSVVEEHTGVVVRHTRTLVILDTGEKFRKPHRLDPEGSKYHLTPHYLDYVTHIVKV